MGRQMHSNMGLQRHLGTSAAREPGSELLREGGLCVFLEMDLTNPEHIPFRAAQGNAGDHRSPLGHSASLTSEGLFKKWNKYSRHNVCSIHAIQITTQIARQ